MEPVDVLSFVLILSIRGLVPFALFRWPFWGALACIAGDAADTIIIDGFGARPFGGHYHVLDKAFDTYYLAFECWVALHWQDSLARISGVTLFLARFSAVVLFEVTGVRELFFFGANIFENFYVYVAGRLQIDRSYRIGSYRNLAIILVFVGAPKLLQEYVMHWRQSQTWLFVKHNILMWDG